MKILPWRFMVGLVGILVLSFLGGIVGYLAAAPHSGWSFFGRFNLTNAGNDQQIIIEQPRNVIVEQDLQIIKIEQDLLPTLVNIYRPKTGAEPLARVYGQKDILSQGFVLTADGWLIAAESIAENLKNKYSAVGYESKEYALNDLIKDSATGIVFARAANANNLPVAKIGRSADLTSGQTLALVSNRRQIRLVNLSMIGYLPKQSTEAVQSSEKFHKVLILDEPLTAADNGAVVVNLKGEIVGLVSAGRVVPADYFSALIKQVLGKKKIIRPVLGVNYLDLAQMEGLSAWGDKGALVYGAPVKNSPAAGKLKANDVIKKVNDTELSVFIDLSEAISRYQPGDKIELLVSRVGRDQTIEVILK